MGWKGVTVMEQRVRFTAEYLKGYFPFNKIGVIKLVSGSGNTLSLSYPFWCCYKTFTSEGLSVYCRRLKTLLLSRKIHPTAALAILDFVQELRASRKSSPKN